MARRLKCGSFSRLTRRFTVRSSLTLFTAALALGGLALAPAKSYAASTHVTAKVQTDTEDNDKQLVITGDAGANQIVIIDVGNRRFVVGLNGTLVNGQSTASFSKTDLQDTIIDMGGGNDLVIVASAISGEEFEADGGAGDDTFIALQDLTIQDGANIDFETVRPRP